MTSFMPVIVVVSSADIPTAFASGLSFRPWRNLSAETSMPRSTTSRPAPCAIIFTRFLPMSWRSPFTVPSSILPTGFTPAFTSSGFRMSMLWFIARAAIRTSGM